MAFDSQLGVVIDTSAVGPTMEQKTQAIFDALVARMVSVDLMLQSKIVNDKLSGQLLQRRTGKLSDSIRVIEVSASPDQISGGVEGGGGVAPYARPLEYGSAPHLIVPVNAKVLAFEVSGVGSNFAPWGGAFTKAGDDVMMVFAKKVMHPGTREYAFMRGTLTENRENIIGEFQDAVKEVTG